MPSLEDAALRPEERRALDRLVELIEGEYGEDLHGVWLYDSRARGEWTHDESDVDVLVVATARPGRDEQRRLFDLTEEAAEPTAASPYSFSVIHYAPERVAQRREIRSFFMQEVDRDKIVLSGKP